MSQLRLGSSVNLASPGAHDTTPMVTDAIQINGVKGDSMSAVCAQARHLTHQNMMRVRGLTRPPPSFSAGWMQIPDLACLVLLHEKS